MKKYLSLILALLMGVFTFTACDDDDVNPGSDIHHTFTSEGVFIVNEGSYYSKINGSLDYLDYKADAVTRGIFAKANGESLGGTPNSALLVNDLLYICAADENRVWVVDSKTAQVEGALNVTTPRELCTDGTNLYVSSYTGTVSKFNLKSQAEVAVSDTLKGNLEGIAYFNDRVYVCTGWNNDYTYNDKVAVLEPGKLSKEREVTVAANPNQLLVAAGQLYVLSLGDYNKVPAQMQRVNTSSTTATKIADATMMTFNAANGRIYLVNAPYGSKPTYSYFDLNTGTVNKFIDGTEVFNPYSIGADPVSGDIFITSLSENPDTHTASYTTDGVLYRYDLSGNLKAHYTIGVNPGTLVFNTQIKQVK